MTERLRAEPWWSSGITAKLLLPNIRSTFSRSRASGSRPSPAASRTVRPPARAGLGGDGRRALDRASAVLVVRSILFNSLFYLNLLVHMAAIIPTLLMPRRFILAAARSWSRSSLWLLRVVCGTQGRVPRAGKDPAGRAAGRLQAPVGMGDVRVAAAVSRLHLHSEARADVAPVLRLVHVARRHDPGRSRRALAGARGHDQARAARARGGTPDHHLPRRHAAAAGRGAELQIRGRPPLRRDRRRVPADRAQFRLVLAAPVVSPLSLARCGSSSSTRSSPASTSRCSSRACRTTSRPPPRGCLRKASASSRATRRRRRTRGRRSSELYDDAAAFSCMPFSRSASRCSSVSR